MNILKSANLCRYSYSSFWWLHCLGDFGEDTISTDTPVLKKTKNIYNFKSKTFWKNVETKTLNVHRYQRGIVCKIWCWSAQWFLQKLLKLKTTDEWYKFYILSALLKLNSTTSHYQKGYMRDFLWHHQISCETGVTHISNLSVLGWNIDHTSHGQRHWRPVKGQIQQSPTFISHTKQCQGSNAAYSHTHQSHYYIMA